MVLAGKNVCITGTLSTMTRTQANDAVRRAGGNPVTSVTYATSLLVAGEKPGSKYDTATRRGIPIINESEFLRMIGPAVDDEPIAVQTTVEKVIPAHYGDF